MRGRRRGGDGATGRQSDGATKRRGDKATGRQSDGATKRRGDKATGQQSDGAMRKLIKLTSFGKINFTFHGYVQESSLLPCS